MIYLWSDTHFNHANIIKYTSRPYNTVADMNADLILRWNATVTDRDDIWFLGDFAFGSANGIGEIFAALRGRKHLVIGNHDETYSAVLDLPWLRKEHLVTLRENGKRAIACHYPLASWKGERKNYLMVHGHCHGTLGRSKPHRFDVGADTFRNPMSLSSLASIAEGQTNHYLKETR